MSSSPVTYAASRQWQLLKADIMVMSAATRIVVVSAVPTMVISEATAGGWVHRACHCAGENLLIRTGEPMAIEQRQVSRRLTALWTMTVVIGERQGTLANGGAKTLPVPPLATGQG